MYKKKLIFSIIYLLCTCSHLPAYQDTQQEFQDWHNGDLIFHDSGNRIQTDAIRYATQSSFTHVGIIKITRKGPVVIEAIGPVVETPLRQFIKRGRNHEYSVFRIAGLSDQKRQQIIREARHYYGRPYDPFFRLDEGNIYCSELPYKIFVRLGIPVSSPQKFKELDIANPVIRLLFNQRWKKHPDCSNMSHPDTCWKLLLEQEIISPVRLTEIQDMKQVYP